MITKTLATEKLSTPIRKSKNNPKIVKKFPNYYKKKIYRRANYNNVKLWVILTHNSKNNYTFRA